MSEEKEKDKDKEEKEKKEEKEEKGKEQEENKKEKEENKTVKEYKKDKKEIDDEKDKLLFQRLKLKNERQQLENERLKNEIEKVENKLKTFQPKDEIKEKKEAEKESSKKKTKLKCPNCGGDVLPIGFVKDPASGEKRLYGRCMNKECCASDKINKGYFRIQTPKEFNKDISHFETPPNQLKHYQQLLHTIKDKEKRKKLKEKLKERKLKQFKPKKPPSYSQQPHHKKTTESYPSSKNDLFSKILKIGCLVLAAVLIASIVYFLVNISLASREGKFKTDINVEGDDTNQNVNVNQTQIANPSINVPVDNYIVTENETIIDNSTDNNTNNTNNTNSTNNSTNSTE